MNNKSVNKFDLRLRDRLIKEKTVSEDEIKQHEASLEDQSENMLDIQEALDAEEDIPEEGSSELEEEVVEKWQNSNTKLLIIVISLRLRTHLMI